MNTARFRSIAEQYQRLRVAVVGDFCLDRYLEIDGSRAEVSIETGRTVHNVVKVRSQPGAAGTILNNLAALGVGQIVPVGFCGVDGEGFELRRALRARPGVTLDYFIETDERRTFTYCKPLVLEHGRAPVELDRLDSKNWTATPKPLQARLIAATRELADSMDVIILMDQVDLPETGVVTGPLLEAVRELASTNPQRWILGDSRRSLGGWPPICLKMNAAELGTLMGKKGVLDLEEIQLSALSLARLTEHPVFITLSERGLLAATPAGQVHHVPTLPIRGEIDIVGAGDAVTANLACALAAGAESEEAIVIANVAASIVIHQLGTTGTATVPQIAGFLSD